MAQQQPVAVGEQRTQLAAGHPQLGGDLAGEAQQHLLVQVRGPFVFVGYARRLEMSRALFDEDGWFDTGDLATLDADGYLSISGRTKDIIVRGGENIPVAYVENVLYENPDYAKVAVVGVSDPRLQERACACIVPADGAPQPTLESMREYLRGKGVSKHYWPERVVALPELPSTASGKIQKYHLREIVEQPQPTPEQESTRG